ncbi:hydrolase [Lactobacillus jensenii]|nr:hydrolase [Lactobacillus jensenii]
MRAKLIKERQKAAIEELTKNAKAEQAKMDAQAKAETEAKAQEEQKQAQQAVTQAPTPTANTTSQANTQNISGVNKGTFKLSFYDPAALGSNMGYGGVAANLSVFPKGTRLKITLSDGTVWYRVVNDTGGFAAANPNQLDVAMPNSQVPAAGILYATVEVIG